MAKLFNEASNKVLSSPDTTWNILDWNALIHLIINSPRLFSKADYYYTEEGKQYLTIDQMRPALIGSVLYYNSICGIPNNVVLAVDKAPYWRKDFIDYKCTRKIGREESDWDFKKIFEACNAVLAEIRESVPWYVLEINRLEADDVMAILAKHFSQSKVTLVASDGDLVQLQKFPNVRQYSPFAKKWVTPKVSPRIDLMHKVFYGDGKDSIPNIMTDKEFYTRKVNGVKERQKRLPLKLFADAERADFDPAKFATDGQMMANFERNLLLLDFDKIPEEYIEKCLDELNSYEVPSFLKLQSYLMKHRLPLLYQKLNQFKLNS